MEENMASARKHPTDIDAYLQEETKHDDILGPFIQTNAPKVLGVIPQKHQPGKWRVITDLYFPKDKSDNDAISTSLCSLSHTCIPVNKVARDAIAHGPGTLLAKINILYTL